MMKLRNTLLHEITILFVKESYRYNIHELNAILCKSKYIKFNTNRCEKDSHSIKFNENLRLKIHTSMFKDKATSIINLYRK